MTGERPARPRLVARRGALLVAPEHTIPAYEAAIGAGADLLEVDVHLSADDHPVVIHDWTLGRTTDGRGAVRDHTVRALKRLDAGRWFGRAFRGQRVQTLSEVIERFRDRVAFAVQLAGGSDFYPSIEERVVTLLQVYDVAGRALVLSRDHHALAKCRDLDPDLCLVARVGARLAPPLLPKGAVHGVCLEAPLVAPADVAAWRHAGLACYVRVVNDPLEARRLADQGATGLVTDRVDLLRPVFAEP